MSYPKDQRSQPLRSLRGFDKLCLSEGETKTARFVLRQKDVAVWDVAKQTWTVPEGWFTAHVGSSSQNLPLRANLVN